MQIQACLCLDPCFKEIADIDYLETVISYYNRIHEVAKKLKDNGWSLEVNAFDGVHVICKHPECMTEEDLVKKLQEQNIEISPELAYLEVGQDELSNLEDAFLEDCGNGGCGSCGCHG